MNKDIIVIPIKENSKGCPHKNRKLINRCLSEVLKTEYEIYVIGDDKELLQEINHSYKDRVKTMLISPIGEYTDVTETIRQWQNKTKYVGYIALVQCTSPYMKSEWIEKCFTLANKNSVVATACEIDFKPTALFCEENGKYVPFAKDRPAASVARQLLPHTVRINGAIEVFHTECLNQKSFWSTEYIIPVIVEKELSLDVDTNEDMEKLK